MSHIVNIHTKITDLDALKGAVAALGWEWLDGQQTYKWFGKFVGDTPMPAGLTKEDLGTCSHAIHIPGAKYEVGVAKAKNGNGWELRYDYWSAGGLEHILGKNAGPLVQQYAVEKTRIQARLMGRSVLTQKTLADGSIQLVIQGR